MKGRFGTAAAALGYIAGGAVLLGGLAGLLGILVNADAGLEGVPEVLILGGAGVVLGGLAGAVVFVWGGKILQQQEDQREDAPPRR